MFFQGRKTQQPDDLEKKIARHVRQMEDIGLGPTLLEFREIVHDYLEENEVNTIFTENRPEKD